MIEEKAFQPAHIGDNSASLKRRLWRYGPVVLWAAVIFFFSSGVFSASNTSLIVRPALLWLFPNITEATLATIHFLLRKAGHFTEYAILGSLAARALRTSSRAILREHWFWMAFVFVAVYSLTDEFHQSFVATRTASIYDCLVDTAGGLAALSLIWLRSSRNRKGKLLPSPFGRG